MHSSHRFTRSVPTSIRVRAAEVLLAAAALLVVAAAFGPGNASARGRRAAAERITFGNETCAPGWGAPNAGLARFAVMNQSGRIATIYLFRATSGAIVGQINHLAPGRTRRLTVRLKPGPYAWGCDLRGLPRHVSDAARVPAHAQVGGPGPNPIPLLTGEISGPLLDYRANVSRLIAALQTRVSTLAQDLRAGNATSAEPDWLIAHLTWLEIGQDDGAYGAFGDLGRQIDGTAAGLVDGTADPQFTGFHRIEFDLYTRNDVSAAANDAARLVSLVNTLAHQKLAQLLPVTPLGLSTWLLRPHEILEDALRDTLSGNDDDYGSGTGLASVTADVAITRQLLRLLSPALAARAPSVVPKTERQLAGVLNAIATTRSGGRWIAVSALPLAQRERIDAGVDAALETLAPIPDVLKTGGGS